MAGPGGTEVGRVSVKVVPDVDGFREKVKKELEEISKMEAEVKVTLDLTELKAQVEEIKALLKSIGDETVKINVKQNNSGVGGLAADTKKAAAEAKKLAQSMKEALGNGEEHRISRITRLMEGLGNAATNVGQAFLGIAASIGESLGNQLASFGQSLTQMIVQLLIWVPLISAIVGGVTFLVGFLAAAFLTLPALLFSIAGPIAAIALGFDGIKKAAKVLGPEIDKLKKRLSNTFAKELTPMFQAIKAVMPQISDGLNSIAISLSKFFTALSQSFTSVEGIKLLSAALQNVNAFLNDLLPGVKAFIDTFLQVASIKEVFQELGGAISNVLIIVKGFFDQAVQNGQLIQGVKNFRLILQQLASLFTNLLTNSLKFFNGATPGIDKFFTALNGFFNRIDWEKLGKAFGDVFKVLGDAIKDIPPQTITSITDSFVKLGEAIGKLLSGKSFEVLIAAFQAFVDLVTFLITLTDGVLEFFAAIGDFFSGIGDWFSKIDLFQAGSDMFGKLWDGIVEKWDLIVLFFESIPDKIGEFFSGAATWLLTEGADIIKGFLDGIVLKFLEVVAWFLALPETIKQLLADALSWLIEKGKQTIQGFLDGATGKFAEVTSFFIGIPAKIVAFFAGAPSLLFNVGVSIMQGLINGIKSMQGALNGVVGSASKGAAGAAQSALKVNSPSKVFEQIGIYVGQGLINGIQSMAPKVAEAGALLAKSVVAPMDVKGSFAVDLASAGASISAVSTSQLRVAAQVDSNGIEDRIVNALSRWTIDGKGLTRTVNNTNTRQNRRG